MSEVNQMLDDGTHSPQRLNLREITSASRVRSELKKRSHKRKLHKKRLSQFERRYSQLALNDTLVSERKRIDYVLVHNSKKSTEEEDKYDQMKLQQQELDRAKFEALMKEQGFTIQRRQVGTFIYTELFCPFKRLCKEAEMVKLEMPIKGCEKLDPVLNPSWYERLLAQYFETDDEDEYISTQFIMNKIEKFVGDEDPNTFFRPAVRSFLVYHILINLDINSLGDDLNPIVRTSTDLNHPEDKKGLPYMLMRGCYIDSFVLHEASERGTIRGDNFLSGSSTSPTPVFDPRKDLDDTWTKPFKFQPLFKIRNYFGERIAFYFAWSGMLCSTLWIPTLFGLCVFFYGMHESATTDDGAKSNDTGLVDTFKDLFGDFKQSFDNGITPYFGLLVCVWGTIFLELWKRKNAELAYEWDVEQFEQNEPDRPTFHGTRPKKDPVTQEYVWYYPFKRQCLKFSFSFSILIVMITMVVISVVAIIMYRVIMDIDYCPEIGATECLMLTTVLSSVLNAISILLLSRLYNILARKLTEWENHRTQTRFDDALIFKLFAFQFVNSYASCFYIAFFRGRFESVGFLTDEKYKDSCEGSCMTQLSFQVLVLMIMKPFPKLLKDIILVWIKRMWRKYPDCCKCLRRLSCLSTTNQVSNSDVENAAKLGKNQEQLSAHLQFLKHEHLKPTLGDFTLDEYTEKIIQYGFLMLFATSFPLAPLLALMTNMFDLRVDAKRLLWWYRRPVAHVAQDIGMWYQILLFVNFAGVVSNAFLIAFTSSWGAKYNTTEKLIIVIGFEHIVFSLKYIVAYLIPDTPSHVTLAIRREQYQIQKKMEDPVKETDFKHLFPVDEHVEEDEDNLKGGSSGGGGGGDHSSRSNLNHSSPSRYSTSVAIQPLSKSTSVMYTRDPTALSEDDVLGTSRYVDPLEQETEVTAAQPEKELWYCGQPTDSDSSATKLIGGQKGIVSPSKKAREPAKRTDSWQMSDTELFGSRNSKVSTSDIRPGGKTLWETVNEVEVEQPSGMRACSPDYPKANMGLFPDSPPLNPRQRLQPGFSTSEC